MDAIGLMGMILTLIFIGGIIGFIILIFTNTIDLDNIKNKVDLNEILIGVMIVGLTSLILATMAYILVNGFCGLL